MTQKYSICIPKIEKNITTNQIKETFNNHNMGNIKDVAIIRCNYNYNKAFINYNEWYDSEKSNKVRNLLDNGENIKIIYDEHSGWFWKCYAARQ